MTRIFIDGAAGTTGLEIEARLEGRHEFTLLKLPAADRKDGAARREALNAADIVILCLPDEAAREAVTLIDNSTTRVIDASSVHRVANGWTYGFPELGFDVAGAMRVSNPGCYPTGFLALVTPLVRAKLIPADWPLTVNAVSGYSGGGKALIAEFEEQPALAHRDYGFSLDHKHLPEMQLHAGLTQAPIFAPAVTHAYRGMIVEIPLHLNVLPGSVDRGILVSTLADFFRDSSVVHVHEEQPELLLLQDGLPPDDGLDLYLFADQNNHHARLVATLDNLGKGASGAAVQNLNLMVGLPSATGLQLQPR